MSPTQRTLAKLRADGFPLVHVSEKWNPHVKIRQDAFGFVDVMAFRGNEVLAVQSTTGDNAMARFHKMKLLPTLWAWLESPTRKVEIHGWRRLVKRVNGKSWQCRIIDVMMREDPNGTRTPVAVEREA